MTRLPACTPAQVERALKRAGFFLDHTRVSHRYYRHPNRPGIVLVPFHRGTLKRGTLSAILKQAHLSRERFLSLL